MAGGDGFSLISAMFLHGGWMHLAGNMLFLWIFGDNLEETLGHWRYLGFYLLCGIVAALAQVMADPNSTVPTVGAPGAIAGVMGGYLLLFPRARVDVLLVFVVFFRVFALPAWVLLVYWFAVQILGGSAADPSGGGVAYWAHAGGFVCGLVLMLPRWPRLGGPRFGARTHGPPPHPEAGPPVPSHGGPSALRRRTPSRRQVVKLLSRRTDSFRALCKAMHEAGLDPMGWPSARPPPALTHDCTHSPSRPSHAPRKSSAEAGRFMMMWCTGSWAWATARRKARPPRL